MKFDEEEQHGPNWMAFVLPKGVETPYPDGHFINILCYREYSQKSTTESRTLYTDT